MATIQKKASISDSECVAEYQKYVSMLDDISIQLEPLLQVSPDLEGATFSKGKNMQRGYYEPAPLREQEIGNARRSRLYKKQPDDYQFMYTYYADGSLSQVYKYGSLLSKEVILYDGVRAWAGEVTQCLSSGTFTSLGCIRCTEFEKGHVIKNYTFVLLPAASKDEKVSDRVMYLEGNYYAYDDERLLTATSLSVYNNRLLPTTSLGVFNNLESIDGKTVFTRCNQFVYNEENCVIGYMPLNTSEYYETKPIRPEAWQNAFGLTRSWKQSLV